MDTPRHPLPHLRHERRLSQAALATLLQTGQSTVAAWENRRRIPAKWLPKLAAVLGTTVEALLPDAPAPPAATIDRRTVEGQIYAAACDLPPDRKPLALATIRAMLPAETSRQA